AIQGGDRGRPVDPGALSTRLSVPRLRLDLPAPAGLHESAAVERTVNLMSCEPIRRVVLVVAVLCGAPAVGMARELARPAPRMAVFWPDGRGLAIVPGELEEKGTLSVWDAATLRRLWEHGEPRGIPSVAFAPDGETLAIACLNDEVKVFDYRTGQLRSTYGGHGKASRAVGFSPGGPRPAGRPHAGVTKVWDVARGR